MVDPPYTGSPAVGPRMEARGASGGGYALESPCEALLDEETSYGSRWVERADGGVGIQEVPLTWEDLLDPQEDDHVPHGDEHDNVTSDAKGALKSLFRARARDDVKVFGDMKVFWKNPSVSRVAPDVMVVFGVKDVERRRESFDEQKEGTRPSFVLEVISRKTAHLDRNKKPGVYRQAKVKECLVVDRLKSPWTITGYRLDATGRRQVKIRPDKQSRYLAKTLGVYFRVAEGGRGLVFEDAVTGEMLLAPLEAREAAEQAREAAEQAREAAEQAREAAEQAREAAERKVAEEAEAREAAERKAAEEAEAREAADAKVQDLLAEIERLKSANE
jgi:Uma2 family endonuclease